jgi:hypothetical protein
MLLARLAAVGAVLAFPFAATSAATAPPATSTCLDSENQRVIRIEKR